MPMCWIRCKAEGFTIMGHKKDNLIQRPGHHELHSYRYQPLATCTHEGAGLFRRWPQWPLVTTDPFCIYLRCSCNICRCEQLYIYHFISAVNSDIACDEICAAFFLESCKQVKPKTGSLSFHRIVRWDLELKKRWKEQLKSQATGSLDEYKSIPCPAHLLTTFIAPRSLVK